MLYNSRWDNLVFNLVVQVCQNYLVPKALPSNTSSEQLVNTFVSTWLHIGRNVNLLWI